jgi:putative ABC transport system permease protein
MKNGRTIGFALTAVRMASLLAPAEWRARLRREWEAELRAESEREETSSAALIRSALGAFADARSLRALERQSPRSERQTMAAMAMGMLSEAKLALRSLLRAPAYTVVAVVTLGLGLGGTAAIYALLDRVVLDPLPYPEPERLVWLDNPVPGVAPGTRWNVSTAQYVYFTDHSQTLESVGLYTMGGANLQTPSGPERVRSATITAEVLSLLGARAHRGRLMTAEDNLPGAPRVVVLSHGYWTRALGADAAIIGRTLSLNDIPREVIGILEPGLDLPDAPPGFTVDAWLPLTIDRAAPFYNSHSYRMVGRLASGADTTSAEAELASFNARLSEAFPLAYRPSFFENTGFRTDTTPLKDSVVTDAVAGSLWILFGGVGLVLLIAGANVANLFLLRMEARRRELAVRAALGAGRGQVARYLIAEGLVLAGMGAVLALLVSQQSLRAFRAMSWEGLPRMNGVALGGSTILFTVGLAMALGVGLAIHPLWLHTRGGPAGALAEGGRSSGSKSGGRFRATLVVTQVAMALVLVVSAGLLVESMRRLTRIDPGVDPEGVLTMQLNVTTARYRDDPALWRLYSQALERLRAIPGVQAAGMSARLPLQKDGFGCTVQAFEQAPDWERIQAEGGGGSCAGQSPTTPGYFEAMGIRLLRGRYLESADADDPSRAAVVVSQAFARRFWGQEDPIGKRVGASGGNRGYHTVVGVVGDVPDKTLDGERALAIYYPIVLNPEAGINLWPGNIHLAVKANASDPSSLIPAIRQAIAEVDPEVPLANVQSLQDVIGRSTAQLSFVAILLGVAAGTALLLAAVGLYGVVSYAVSRRTREIGMRIALGAKPKQVEWMVVGQSLRLAALGLIIGVGAALAATRVLEGMLYGVEPTEPVAFAMAATMLIGVTVLASWIPARRASRVDPSEALRGD